MRIHYSVCLVKEQMFLPEVAERSKLSNLFKKTKDCIHFINEVAMACKAIRLIDKETDGGYRHGSELWRIHSLATFVPLQAYNWCADKPKLFGNNHYKNSLLKMA